MSYMVPTSSDQKHRALMHFLDKVQGLMQSRELNPTEYQSLVEFKLKVNQMRFGNKPELEYPHWAEAYNRTQELLDQPRRVPIAGGVLSERHPHKEEENVITELYREEFNDAPIPDQPTHPHENQASHEENE